MRLTWYEKVLLVLMVVGFLASIIEFFRERNGYPIPFGTMTAAAGILFCVSLFGRTGRQSK